MRVNTLLHSVRDAVRKMVRMLRIANPHRLPVAALRGVSCMPVVHWPERNPPSRVTQHRAH